MGENVDERSYAVFVVTLKKSFVKKHRVKDENYPNLLVMVRKKCDYEKAIKSSVKGQADLLGVRKLKGLRRIAIEEGVVFHQFKPEAYRDAYRIMNALRENKRLVEIHGERGLANYKVYCIALKSDAWKNKKFCGENTHLEEIEEVERQKIPAFYVGQTGKEVADRYHQHIDVENIKSTKWGVDYFEKPYDKAIQESLIERFEFETGQKTRGLFLGESLIIEEDFKLWLRKQGFGAYSA